jgi:hypothetical protein
MVMSIAASHPAGNRKRGDAQQAEDQGHAHAGAEQARGQDRTDRHGAGGYDVRAGDGARAMVGLRPGLNGGKGRHRHQAARDRYQQKIDEDMSGEVRPPGNALGGSPQVEHEDACERGADDGWDQPHPPARQPCRQKRSGRDADAEGQQGERRCLTAGAERQFDQPRQQPEGDGAHQPEPGIGEGRPPDAPVVPQIRDQGKGRGDDIALNGEIRRRLAGRRNELRGHPTQHGEDQHRSGQKDAAVGQGGGKPASRGSSDDREECRAFH